MAGATAHHLLELGALVLAVALGGALADRYGHAVVPVYILTGVVPGAPTEILGVPVPSSNSSASSASSSCCSSSASTSTSRTSSTAAQRSSARAHSTPS